MTAIEESEISIQKLTLPVVSANTLVVGSGAAGLNTVLKLHELGQKSVVLATDRFGAGASFNAGSDKQTYYKLSLAGGVPDSPRKLAEDLFSGGCMHGDIALCEAQHSAEAFYNLARLGVPFPHDQYGAYVGYRTDHDSAGRATSAGPLTSRMMCECLAEAIRAKGALIKDDHEVVALLWERIGKETKRIRGAIAIDRKKAAQGAASFVLFNVQNVVLATGGPGGMYKTSVYPESQVGATGLGLAIGAIAQNLTESQFGLASLGFRWNLSGSYQQVIPRYVSADASGGDEREFLAPVFPDLKTMTTAIFRKGYQWPFDAEKVMDFGSSLIDVLVYREIVEQGRRVFLDFRRNPGDGSIQGEAFLDQLDPEAHDYLEKSDALRALPIERLEAMNPQAKELYRKRGIDLAKQPLEIAVCAQHSNGGLQGNIWWESNIKHLFPVGEVNGSHGVRRPGGAALNAGQVGSLRAALCIARRYDAPPLPPNEFLKITEEQIRASLDFAERVTRPAAGATVTPEESIQALQERMSTHGAHIRNPDSIEQAADEARQHYENMQQNLSVPSGTALPQAFRALDLCLSHAFYLEAIREYLAQGGRSRGSALVLDPTGHSPCDELGDAWRFSFSPADAAANRKILELWLDEGGAMQKRWVDTRPIPDEDGWFEKIWKDYREGRIIQREDSNG
jgi:succinate dehydrogenase/fumarate reductase flavoprotein subunit